jgi:hypothetical protein
MGENLRRFSYICLKNYLQKLGKSQIRGKARKNPSISQFFIYWMLGLFIAVNGGTIGQRAIAFSNNLENVSCPRDLETLTNRLLKDLPSYTNRVIQRSRQLDRNYDIATYVLLAGRPEFKPLPLKSLQYNPVLPDTSQQVFFTTLERQYGNNKVIRRQNYHWLFLTQSSDGWRLALVFTQFGAARKDEPPNPPQENSNGAIGQAIRLWLRDCRAGTIRNKES